MLTEDYNTNTLGSRQDYKQQDITRHGIHRMSRRHSFFWFAMLSVAYPGKRHFRISSHAAEVTPRIEVMMARCSRSRRERKQGHRIAYVLVKTSQLPIPVSYAAARGTSIFRPTTSQQGLTCGTFSFIASPSCSDLTPWQAVNFRILRLEMVSEWFDLHFAKLLLWTFWCNRLVPPCPRNQVEAVLVANSETGRISPLSGFRK
ncbi:hypothetical protein B0T20DRAFT_98876 [Sordaria brevicollis]|uniref:Uncharacterized protein n=1 Tax=Sordaria brevicollis TaxID=83679 RepID=A0AAE0NW03_SORBR|nr:hypothetical protein B0T20DRAFT_98876 [Sordaria brevicollis]